MFVCCLRYCKSTIFQANHNLEIQNVTPLLVVCDTAKVRFFKQITTGFMTMTRMCGCLRYCKSTIFQANHNGNRSLRLSLWLFAILQKYDFSSKSQHVSNTYTRPQCCLRYCKSTIFQANHNRVYPIPTTILLFAILQKYDFSSKSQPSRYNTTLTDSCLRYCKSTIFQANHNLPQHIVIDVKVVCDTAKVRFFKQITTILMIVLGLIPLFAILQKYDFSSKSQRVQRPVRSSSSCLRYCKSTIFQANHNCD